MTDYYRAFSTSTFKFLGQIQSTNIDISYKSILTCLSNNEKNRKNYRSEQNAPPSLLPPTPLMGLSYGDQSLCRVPPSPVHLHDGAPMRYCCNSSIFETKSLICSFVGAFLLLSRGAKFVSVLCCCKHVLCPKSARVLSSCYSLYL